ncbi:MAG: HlyD family efflux transporter periplasmic adaptor subunit [Rhodospirillaceae bacterium]|jgi:HlyD family secretion protein|nr:HlyD family efflux transporter periplasmic adaptor subunit [Rhodospirillaceae bacterium]MBT5079140.1 HlyD family efflux transporter periplasmic adaptor subunit [Rhodospirillaceae bacterium]MBT5527494.1 HlyD family efflux transporter periplasmic adaptor subunit [Rhodospirillaceae bacterium]MBT5878677.1 HlyD family efflux transporter periplasmic adaptor subunit [Rhodospirillaceae bacterium]MBT6588570.1 HlyD family efflux transporter periplasmic adaptor subunit [Rhodospirillaceae bacterium]
MVSPWPRRVGYLVAIVAVAGGLAYAFKPQPIAVNLATVTIAPMIVTLDEEGRTRVKDIYVVSAPVSGRKLRLTQKVGATVIAQETVLASIEPSDPAFLDVRSTAEAKARIKAAQAAQTLAEAELKRNRAELDFARADFDRAQALVRRGTISKREQERAQLGVRTKEAAVSTAQAGLRVKRFELETANAALIDPAMQAGASGPSCCVTVLSPIDGQILRLVQESAAVVPMGAPLVEVGDPRALEIVVDLLSSDAVQVQTGDEVHMTDWGGGITLTGQVRRVEPAGFTKISALGVEEQRVNVLIDFTDPPERYARLGHGYRVEARIVVWRGDNVLQVPMGVLFREGQDWAVFASKDGLARLQRVKIGRTNGEQAQIIEGLAVGDQVIEHPSDILNDGDEVVARHEG